MSKRISIVMAACNGEKYIADQISSILSQLNDEDELIITVDPSTDRTETIIQSFSDSRIRLIHGPGQGIIRNFEHALAKAEGEFIFLADQDDIWHPDKLKKVVSELTKPECLLVLHDCRIVDKNLDIQQPSYFSWHGTKKGFANNLLRNSFIGCCMAFRRSLLDTALPFPVGIPMHDQWLGLIACKIGHVTYLQEQLLDYRRHSGNQSSLDHSNLITMIRWRLMLLKALKGRILQ